ncbi:peptide ABC transporter substrate-binding protein [Streptomyces badius]
MPADTNESNGSYVIQSLFTQLLDFVDKGEIVLIRRVRETEDSKVCTVKLKAGGKFHNGEAVTAQSYIDAWNWYANVENKQQNAFWFSDIKGYEDVHPEKGAPKAKEMSGLDGLDDTTFTIELTTRSALHQEVPTFGCRELRRRPDGGSGRCRSARPVHVREVDPQEAHPGQGLARVPGPEQGCQQGHPVEQYSTVDAAHRPRAGNPDMIRQVGPRDLPKYKTDLGDGAIDQPYAAIQTLVPAFYSKTFKDIDPKVLQGLSMAIDRDTITKTVLNGTRIPATSFTPPQSRATRPSTRTS